VVEELCDHGMLAIPAGDNVVRFVPPLIIEDRHVDEAMTILDASCRELGESSA
jgi:acetylornithine/N-succinyldiaminopimelate aminotransferase